MISAMVSLVTTATTTTANLGTMMVMMSKEILTTVIAIIITTIVLYYWLRTQQQLPKNRFRKRDKVAFYCRRLVRRVGKIKKKQLLKFNKRDYIPPPVEIIEPSQSFQFSTVAILSNSDEVPISSFSRELNHALTAIGPVLLLTSDIILEDLGLSTLEDIQECELSTWLSQQEAQYKTVLYQCDSTLTPWTLRCMKQVDCILIVAMADMEPNVGILERHLRRLSVRAQKELILLHRQESDKPKGTTTWLNMHSWCSSHHHIRCPQRVFVKKTARMNEIYTQLSRTNPPNDNDFARLARFLTGTSIGLVLGGGGARGAAHLGIIKAIREAGIPIDMVGGVSIGAFMSALWAQETDFTKVTQVARSWSFTTASYWRQLLDLTYPVTAMFTGSSFNRNIYNIFGDRQIEDLWLPYFTVTTDITSSAPRVHRYGSLWRYVRSSMSLSGYLPPLCDPVDGHLLLDGGYVNNLPADVMHDIMGASAILAVDVGSQDETDLTNYGDTLNGWWLLWNKWNPFGKPVRVPSLPEIQSRLAYVSCVRHLEEVKKKEYCKYIRPPIDRYKTLQFSAFDEILEIGYKFGMTSNLLNAKNLFQEYTMPELEL